MVICFFRESAISGDEETVATPVFDCSKEKTLGVLGTSTMASSWNATNAAVEMLPAASDTTACTLHDIAESTGTPDDKNPLASSLSKDSAYDVINFTEYFCYHLMSSI